MEGRGGFFEGGGEGNSWQIPACSRKISSAHNVKRMRFAHNVSKLNATVRPWHDGTIQHPAKERHS